jgi:hypothetical protein
LSWVASVFCMFPSSCCLSPARFPIASEHPRIDLPTWDPSLLSGSLVFTLY